MKGIKEEVDSVQEGGDKGVGKKDTGRSRMEE